MVTLSKGMPQEKPLKWTSVDVQEVIDLDIRLDAESFGIEGRQARNIVAQCKWRFVYLCGENGLAIAYHKQY